MEVRELYKELDRSNTLLKKAKTAFKEKAAQCEALQKYVRSLTPREHQQLQQNAASDLVKYEQELTKLQESLVNQRDEFASDRALFEGHNKTNTKKPRPRIKRCKLK